MRQYLVYIETVGDPMTGTGPTAHVPALPGASARGQTIEEAKEKIRAAVEEYLALLRDVGEPVPRASEGIHLEFEEVDKTTFPTDYDSLHPNELETLFRWMAISRQELVDLVRDLPEETLDHKLADNTPSIREILCHTAEADLWYTDRLKRWPEAPLFRLAATRGIALERLRALQPTDFGNFTIYDGKKWTPRKVMRRMLEHEREQIQQIRALLAAMPSK
ncbi:MAG: type II toxin-antitoxin system HicB family antitoxin [Anaerolineae bacterium]|nr:type II toxin-antitoxin system HicB family antitoxin [Anaerolineae bacterium]